MPKSKPKYHAFSMPMPNNGWQDRKDEFIFRSDNLRLSIHHYLGYPSNDWFVSCHDLGIKAVPIFGKDPEELKRAAVAVVQAKLDVMQNDLKGA